MTYVGHVYAPTGDQASLQVPPVAKELFWIVCAGSPGSRFDTQLAAINLVRIRHT